MLSNTIGTIPINNNHIILKLLVTKVVLCSISVRVVVAT